MAIKSIDVVNVMPFRRQWRINNADCMKCGRKKENRMRDGFRLEFCDGINVLIGENGTGKTTLLKMIYAASQWSTKQTDAGNTKHLLHFFLMI